MHFRSKSTSDALPLYQYTAIPPEKDCIRVFELRSSLLNSSEISGQLTVHERSTRGPEYAALSYTWGSNEKSKAIVLSGCRFPVTANLFAALMRLRTRGVRYLWIDAICINQNDDEEKTMQVALMGEIYKHASKVYGWLGEDDAQGSGQHSFELAKRIYKWRDVYEARVSRSKWAKKRAALDDAREGEETAIFFSWPWFYRIWIVQEMFYGRGTLLMCGGATLDWETFMEFIKGDRDGTHDGIAVGLIPWLVRRLAEMNSKSRKPASAALPPDWILKVMEWAFQLQCSDPRDHIAAFLPMFPGFGFRIDYRLSATTNFINFATHAVQARLVIPLLRISGDTCVTYNIGRDPELPSWVPDWRVLHKVHTHGWWGPWDKTSPFAWPDRIDLKDAEVHGDGRELHVSMLISRNYNTWDKDLRDGDIMIYVGRMLILRPVPSPDSSLTKYRILKVEENEGVRMTSASKEPVELVIV
jgi:hypothetical protein